MIPEFVLPSSFWQRPVIVAVSGGSDSVALLRLLVDRVPRGLPPRQALQVAHFDHQWQADSDSACQFVRELATTLGLEFHWQTAESLTGRTRRSTSSTEPDWLPVASEANARDLRYRYFRQLVTRQHAGFLVTGHTRDDQVETIWMRIARGTGIDGLTGIPERRSLTPDCQLYRPLLDSSRMELRQYLGQIQQPFCDDPTNQWTHLTRNHCRKIVLPWIRDHVTDDFDQHLMGLSQSANDWKQITEYLAKQAEAAVKCCQPGILQVDVRVLSDFPEPLVRQLLSVWWARADLPRQEMNRQQWKHLAALACRPALENAWPAEWHFPGPVVGRRSAGILTVRHQEPTKKPPE